MGRPVRLAILEPYYGGSHAAFLDAWTSTTRHEFSLASLPARKWKWRMRGAAIWFAQRFGEWATTGGGDAEVIFCSDMLCVADLRALLPTPVRELPIVCYFHENQLTYPLQDERLRDYQYGMTNITSCLAADALWFNSAFHLESYLTAAEGLLRKMPDYMPEGVTEQIRAKSDVLPPPVSVEPVDRDPRPQDHPPTILWCHRWEYDKNPGPFFDALLRLAGNGYRFNLVLLGEQFREAPEVFASVWPQLDRHVVHAGFVPDRDEYLNLLSRCDVVVSTAIQENFGVAVVEAILCGCQPLLPSRLAYPEVIPVEFHPTCLYRGDADLYKRLASIIKGPGRLEPAAMRRLRAALHVRFGLEPGVERLDDAVASLAASFSSRPSREN